MRFEFATATRIVFGAGTLADVGRIAAEFGQRPVVITGRDAARAQRLLDILSAANMSAASFSVAGEPSTDDIARGVAHARTSGCDFVIGFGGGSVLDAAKAIAALLTNDGDLFDYLEVIGRAQPLAVASAPCIAIPTTAGTGSEVTRNAVLSSPAHRVKVSLRSPHLLPRVALVDPELTYELPPELTATTGLDALTQLIEPFISSRANPLSDALCHEGLQRAARSLHRAVENGRDSDARNDMALASLFGGLALANSGLGAVHGFAAPLGGMFAAPHGAICAALLPHVMETNLQALRARAPSHYVVRRYAELGRILTGKDDATAEDGIRWVQDLVTSVRIPPLGTYGINAADIAPIVKAATNASSMKANPLPLTERELTSILERSL